MKHRRRRPSSSPAAPASSARRRSICCCSRRAPGRVVIFDDLSRGTQRQHRGGAARSRGSRWSQGDIRDREAVARVMEGADAVIHLAALRITACAAEPRAGLRRDVRRHLQRRRSGPAGRRAEDRRRLHGLGLRAGGAVSRPTEDHHPYDNRTWYGASKMMLEGLLRSFNDMYGLPYVALRYFNVYGPRMDIHGKYTEVLIRWMERLDAGSRRSSSATAARRWTSSTSRMWRGRTCWRWRPTCPTRSATSAAASRRASTSWPRRCRASWACARAPEYGPGAEGQRRAAPAGVNREGASACWASRRSVTLEEGLSRLVTWWRARARPA